MAGQEPLADRNDAIGNHRVMMRRRKFYRGAAYREDEGLAAIANVADDAQFMAPKRGVNGISIIHSGGGEHVEKCGLRLEKMDIGIPQRIVSVEDQIEAAVARAGYHRGVEPNPASPGAQRGENRRY